MAKRDAEPLIPDLPGWEDDLARDELEYQRDLKKQGEQEALRMWDNRREGDIFGYDDGRPGIGVGLDPLNGTFLTIPLTWRFALGAVGFALIAIAALATRACVGEEETQRILHGDQPAAASQTSSGSQAEGG